MDATKTHGVFSWNELCTADPGRAAEFYGTLFGWQVQDVDMGEFGSYRLAKIGDTAVAGLMGPPPGEAMPTAWSSYVTVTDVDKTLAQALQMGARPAMPAMDVPGVGRMAGFIDPQGAMINIITYEPGMGGG